MLKIYRILILTAVSGSALLLATGCGQRGPLYLPEEASPPKLVEPAQSPDAATQQAPAAGSAS